MDSMFVSQRHKVNWYKVILHHFCILDEVLPFYLYCCLYWPVTLSCFHELYRERSKDRSLEGRVGEKEYEREGGDWC